MKAKEIFVGRRYLTRTIGVPSPLGLGLRKTRGMIEILELPREGYVKVKWLMRDGTERKNMPRSIRVRDVLTPVIEPYPYPGYAKRQERIG